MHSEAESVILQPVILNCVIGSMARKRHHKLNALFAALLSVLLWFGADVEAGPVAGQRQALDSDNNSPQREGENEAKVANSNGKTATPDELVSSYLNALKRQVLPDMGNPSLNDVDQINLDGLQGWSLDDIKAAMDAAALGLDDTTGGNTPLSENTPNPLTVSVDDLYNFNAGYYFVIGNNSQNDGGDLVSGPNLPEIVGETALSEVKLDIVSISETGINLGIETGVGMLDDSFFTPLNSSSANQSFGGRGFRSGIGSLSGGRQGSGANSNEQTTSLAGFISQTIQFFRENSITIGLVVFGFTAIGYFTSRFA